MSRLSRSEPVSRQPMEMDMTDATRKPTSQGLRSGLFLIYPEPESKTPHERRHGPYRPKPTGTDDVLTLGEFIRILSACIGALVLLAWVVL